jgi:hypothetical protein
MTIVNAYTMKSEEELSPTSSLFPAEQPSTVLSSSGPTPNPPFVFPARNSSSAPSSYSRATGRRPISAYELHDGAAGFGRDSERGVGRSLPPPLPSFSFSPTASSYAGTGIASPPLSPNSPGSARTIPSRPGGHRRGGSEFIGGDGISGTGLGLMSTSPIKGDGILPPPNTNPSLGPPAGRPGHRHRRSAAISCHDISTIIKPASSNNMPLGGSAPTSPAGNENQVMSFPGLDTAVQSNAAPATPSTEVGETGSLSDSPPTRASNRNRVGFSDTVEFIPRPLSLVSSDASSTTTMRPGHSVSNSLSSLMSAGAASPSSKDQKGTSTQAKSVETRPKTAGAILGSKTDSLRLDDGRPTPQRRNSLELTPNESTKTVETPSTPRLLPRKYFFFGHDTSGGESSPTRSRPVSAASSDKSRSASNLSAPSPPDSPATNVPIASVEEDRVPTRKPSITRKPSKKQKKVRSWAGSILSRKPRQRSQKQKALSRRSPTPPLRTFEPMVEVNTISHLNQVNTLSATYETSQPPNISNLPNLQTNFASWKPRHVMPQDDESMSPIIDLDAALGPFNTPSGYDADWEASQKGPGHTKRRMHSAAGLGGFLGPYHRRAESAPEMAAFENPRFGLHHIGSRSTMEDVFEEDEEDDDWEEMKTVSHKGSKSADEDEEASDLGIDIKVVDAENMNSDKIMDWTASTATSPQRGVKRKGSGLSEGERRQMSSCSKSELSPDDEPVAGEDTIELENADGFMGSRPDSAARSSDSTPTPPLRPQHAKELAPVDIQPINFQPPFLTPTSFSSTTHSSFPSPRSPMSYDAQRISTAPSSVTDEHAFQSLLLGEPGPELRMSVDDVPSLTSSTSTMTRESAINPGFNNPQFRNGQRSASLSSSSVTQKRSSIASLSRLLHSSHGEKSKLSIEQRAPTSPEKKEKERKGKRLSRMMQFWKPKEVSSS